MRLRGRPTLQTLVAIVVVFVLQQVVGLVSVAGNLLFVLDPAVAARPWTAVTHVYAHANVGHLLSNAIGLALAGPFVARRTTTARFHLFFVTTGIIAGLAEVFVGTVVSSWTGVLGASGAVLALIGYLLAGNVVAAGVLERLDLSRRAQFALLAVVVVLMTLATASPRAALVGHAVGFACGLVAGRLRVLDMRPRQDPQPGIGSRR